MSSGTLAPVGRQQFSDANGNPLAGGKVYFYASGTTTPQDTFTDSALLVPNANPVILDAGGFPPNGGTIYLSATSYKMLVKTSADVTQYTVDPLPATNLSSSLVTDTISGRLTLTSGTAVTTGDVSGATSLYFTPFRGNHLALYDGSQWSSTTFSELSISLAGKTASTPYDVFVYSNSGTLTLELLAWTNTTTRATALATQDGVYVKTGATTRRYLGTIYINASGGQTDDTFAKRYVWNYYNRVRRQLRVIDATASWTYTTGTYRQANASTANQADIVVGVAEVGLDVTVIGSASNTNASIERAVAIGEDSTSTPLANQLHVSTYGVAPPAGQEMIAIAQIRHYPAVGRHFYAWLEKSTATGTTTWFGSTASGTSNSQAGMVGSLEG